MERLPRLKKRHRLWGGSHVAAGAQGNEIEAAGAEAISEVHNMLPDPHSEEKSAVAE